MSQVAQQEALTRLLIEKEMFIKEEFLDTVRAVGRELGIQRSTLGREDGPMLSFFTRC